MVGPSAGGAALSLGLTPHDSASQTLLCFGILLVPLPAWRLTRLCCPLLLPKPCLWGFLRLPDRSSRWLTGTIDLLRASCYHLKCSGARCLQLAHRPSLSVGEGGQQAPPSGSESGTLGIRV